MENFFYFSPEKLFAFKCLAIGLGICIGAYGLLALIFRLVLGKTEMANNE